MLPTSDRVEQPASISTFQVHGLCPRIRCALFQRAARRTVQMAKLVRDSGRHTGGGQAALLPVG